MKALVLGGTGFVGMNVVRALVRAGHDVVATRRTRANTLFARRLGARLQCAELSDVDSLVSAMRGREVVFNCAAHYPRFSLDFDEEVRRGESLTATSIKAAQRAGVQRYVLTSSVATVGPPRPGRILSDEDDVVAPSAKGCVYHGVKLAIERQVLRAQDRGLDCVVLCPTGIVGELDVKAGTGFIVLAIAHGKLPVHVDGRTNIVDADDLAAAHVAAAQRGRPGQRYIVAGHNLTIRRFMEHIAEELGVSLHSWRMPLRLAAFLSTVDEMRCASQRGGTRPFLAREFVDMVRHGQWVDRSKSVAELGLEEPAELATTIRKACRWYQKYGYLGQKKQTEPTGECTSAHGNHRRSDHAQGHPRANQE